MEEHDTSSKNHRPDDKTRPIGMNGELLAGILVSSISAFWFFISYFIFHVFFWTNLYIFLAGVLILLIGIIKYYRVKNTDLDF